MDGQDAFDEAGTNTLEEPCDNIAVRRNNSRTTINER